MTRASLPQPLSKQNPLTEATTVETVAHGAVDAAVDVADAVSVDLSEATNEVTTGAMNEEPNAPSVVPQRQRPRGLPDLPPDMSRFCCLESQFRSISAV